MSVRIKTVSCLDPQYSRKTADVLPYLDLWLKDQEPRFIKKVKRIFEQAGVSKRYSIMSPEEVFNRSSFEEKNKIYVKEGVKLATKCLQNALKKADWQAHQLDYIITVSCTGVMIPSMDAYIINTLNLRQDIVRLPVTEMGCAAGVSGIIYAWNFLKANPNKRAAVIAVESPTATFQLDDFSMANIVSAAIFGDGAACALLSSHTDDKGPEIIAGEMYHFYDTIPLMGFDLTNAGLKMVLDITVPDQIEQHFPDVIYPFLAKNGFIIDDIMHLIFHPGGKKIIDTVENLFSKLGKNINETKNILKEYGNMSSATVLYVLQRYMERPLGTNELGLMLSFGPGFSAQRLLLRW